MEKSFLLIAGDYYYPRAGTGNWVARFETYAQAESAVVKTDSMSDAHELGYNYKIDGRPVCWYEIVDLNTACL